MVSVLWLYEYEMKGCLGCYAGLKFWVCWTFNGKAGKGWGAGCNKEEFEGMLGNIQFSIKLPFVFWQLFLL